MNYKNFLVASAVLVSLGVGGFSFEAEAFAATKEREKRYEIQIKPIPRTFWHGIKPLDKLEMRGIIVGVLGRLPHIDHSDDRVMQLLETAKIETNLGEFKTGRKSHGVFQVHRSTAKEILSWTKKNHPDVHQAIMSFYDNKKDLIFNLDYNVPFNTALSATYYWMRSPKAKIETRGQRAKVWLKVYNTYLGAGTKNAYMKRTKGL